MTDSIIHARNVSKSFKKAKALDSCDVEFPAGRIIGLLGENGAGKTTLMRILAGLVRPSSGTVQVFGLQPGSRAVANRIGVTIEGSAYYPWLCAHRNVDAMHRGFGRVLGSDRIDVAIERVGLEKVGRRRAATLSQGQRQRLALAVAIAHEPDLLVLDEPANGLDPTGMADLRRLIVAERDRGATVLVSSHLLAELEEFCDTVVMMHRGRVVGTRDLDDAQSGPCFLIELLPEELVPAQRAFRESGVITRLAGDRSLLVEIDSGRSANQILAGGGIVPESVSMHHSGLEEYYFACLKEAGE